MPARFVNSVTHENLRTVYAKFTQRNWRTNNPACTG